MPKLHLHLHKFLYSLLLAHVLYVNFVLMQRALLEKSVITTKELAILALLNGDPEDSSDEDCRPSNHCTPTKHNCTPTKHSPLKAEGYYCDSSDSEISVTRISPVKERVKENVGASCDGTVLGELHVRVLHFSLSHTHTHTHTPLFFQPYFQSL